MVIYSYRPKSRKVDTYMLCGEQSESSPRHYTLVGVSLQWDEGELVRESVSTEDFNLGDMNLLSLGS